MFFRRNKLAGDPTLSYDLPSVITMATYNTEARFEFSHKHANDANSALKADTTDRRLKRTWFGGCSGPILLIGASKLPLRRTPL